MNAVTRLLVSNLVLLFILAGCARKPEVVPPQQFDAGPGPVSMIGLHIDCNRDVTNPGSIIRLSFDPDGYQRMLNDTALQLRVFVESPDHEMIVFYSAGRAMLVTSAFELLSDSLPLTRNAEYFTLEIGIPIAHRELQALASLGWDVDPVHRCRTAVSGLTYYGFEIGQLFFGPGGIMNEIYFQISTEEEIRLAKKKSWPIPDWASSPADTSNPRGTPGRLYRGFPLEFEGDVLFYEYSHRTGFVKRVLIDTNGNKKRDPGETDGYVGRCSFTPGTNKQTMSADGSTWTSELDNLGGQRIRHVLKKRTKEDGTEEWVVESTHEEQRPGNKGKWTKTEVPDGFQNPVVNPPYDDPSGVPNNGTFGLPPAVPPRYW